MSLWIDVDVTRTTTTDGGRYPHPTNDGKRPPPPRHGIVANCPSRSYYARRERDDGRYSRRAIVSRYRPLPPTHPTRGGTLGLPQRDTYIIRQHAPPRPTRRAESPPIILLFAERAPPTPPKNGRGEKGKGRSIHILLLPPRRDASIAPTSVLPVSREGRCIIYNILYYIMGCILSSPQSPPFHFFFVAVVRRTTTTTTTWRARVPPRGATSTRAGGGGR